MPLGTEVTRVRREGDEGREKEGGRGKGGGPGRGRDGGREGGREGEREGGGERLGWRLLLPPSDGCDVAVPGRPLGTGCGGPSSRR